MHGVGAGTEAGKVLPPPFAYEYDYPNRCNSNYTAAVAAAGKGDHRRGGAWLTGAAGDGDGLLCAHAHTHTCSSANTNTSAIISSRSRAPPLAPPTPNATSCCLHSRSSSPEPSIPLPCGTPAPRTRKSRGRGRGKGSKTTWKPLPLASASEFPSLRKTMPRPPGPSHKERLLSEERQINIRQMAEWRYSPAAAHGASPPAPWQFPMEERLLAHAKDLRDGFVAPDTGAGFRDGPSNESIPQSNTTVFVGGLPAEASADVLRLVFGVWGDIEICNIPKGGRGCAFITFFERHAAEDALYFMQGFPLYDSKLRPAWGHDNRTNRPARAKSVFALSDSSDFLADYLELSETQRQLLKRFVDEAEGEDFELFKRVHTMPTASSSSSSWPSRPVSADRHAAYPYGPYRNSPDYNPSDEDETSSTLPSLSMSSPSSTSTSIAPAPHDHRPGQRTMTPFGLHDASCPRLPAAPATTEDKKLFAPFAGLTTSDSGGAFGWSSNGVYPSFTPTFSPPKPRKLSNETISSLDGGKRLSLEAATANAWKDCGCPDSTEIRGTR